MTQVEVKPQVQIQIREGRGWRNVTHREGSEMDHPEPVHAKDIGVQPGDICRLALTYDGHVVRKRYVIAED